MASSLREAVSGKVLPKMAQSAGLQIERLDAIRSHLYAHGFSNIQALADAVGASLVTYRVGPLTEAQSPPTQTKDVP